jgi:chromosome segregation ATPase
VELRPGKHLNLIIGPNGSGKSTIVSAMCLGLGGSTSVLDRQKQIDSFIKHGETKATIEIELQRGGEGNSVLVKREIESKGAKGTSNWFINNKAAPEKEVLKLTKSLNIQIDNLCQFVPQERVSAFADLSVEELLKETQGAAGGDALIDEHKALIDLGVEKTKMRSDKDDYEQRLTALTATFDASQAEYDRYMTRKDQTNTIKVLEEKLPWIEYERDRVQYEASKDEVLTTKERLKVARTKAGPAEAELNEAKKKTAEKTEETHQHTAELSKCMKTCEKLTGIIEEKNETVDNLTQDMEGFGPRMKKLEQRIRQHQTSIQENRDLLSNNNVDELKPLQKEVMHKLTAIKQSLVGIQRKQRDIKEEKIEVLRKVKNTQQSIRGLSNQKDLAKKKLFQSQQRDKQNTVRNACEWLDSNKDKFRQEVYDAICLHIEMIKKEDAKFVETMIPFQDLTAMIAQNSDDHRTLLSSMRDAGNKVTAFMDPHPQKAREPRFSDKDLKRYGFRCVVSDLFKAPDPIMRYLTLTHNLHLIPVGPPECEKHATELFEKFGIVRFIAGNSVINVSKSDYGARNVNIRNSNIKEANLLGAAANEDQLTILKDDQKRHEQTNGNLENLERQLNKEESELREDEPALMKKKDEYRKRVDAITTAEQKVKRVEDAERNTVKALEDLKKEKLTYARKFKTASLEHVASVLKLENAFKALTESTTAFVKLKIELFDLTMTQRGKRMAFDDQQEEVKEQQVAYDKAKETSSQKKDVARQTLKKAQAAIGGLKEPDAAKQAAFDLEPNDVDKIEEKIAEQNAKLNIFQDVDKSTVDEHEATEKEIVKLKKTQEKFDEKYTAMNERIEAAKESWYPRVKGLVEKISSEFSESFGRLKNCGEVRLREHESDYSKYGIEIWVRFRGGGTKMQMLQGTVQSGGEKSVSTMLYLMALQSLTKCPFRVVDEINQGMDATNERKIYGQVREAVGCGVWVVALIVYLRMHVACSTRGSTRKG